MLPPLDEDPRLAEGLRLVDAEQWLEASDLFEELFFESVRDEVALVRFFLQYATGMHHISRGQRRAAAERLEEALIAADQITRDFGVDVPQHREAARRAIERLRA